ncbi:selenide, water dikinase SelD [Kistimonas scapharcae]|uniref:Selenide, water dikinase n=2 Tax=Kistimonas scapharcae TaxID=1036133 RepID=A0ABP8V7A3_9GAMM
MLEGLSDNTGHPSLLVGNDTADDAAVYALDNDEAIISTTDFFMPIVDDPYDFGRIAAANAISDVYAMGGTPMMALAILGWPINTLPPEVARDVLRGGRDACRDAGMPLAGGHSIDTPEPIFGLSVNGRVPVERLKRNSGAKAGDRLYLTKPLGIGILSTAIKKGHCQPEHERLVTETMCRLNKPGAAFAAIEGVTAMTDVTGFGLLGHLLEMCEGSGLGAVVYRDAVPLLPDVDRYLALGCAPGGSQRNYDSYGERIAPITERDIKILLDPQTSGGLLVAVSSDAEPAFLATAREEGLVLETVGHFHDDPSPTAITLR